MTLTEEEVPRPSESMFPTPSPSLPQTPRRVKVRDLAGRLWRMFHSEIHTILSKEELTFEELAMFIQKKETVLITARFWSTLCALCKAQKLKPGDISLEEKKTARVLLAAVMINRFPVDVLDNADINSLDPFSDQCYQAALFVVETTLRPDPETLEKPRRIDLEEIHKGFEDFMTAFNTWKAQDKRKVVESLEFYYEQWAKSKKVLSASSLNDSQREAIISQFDTHMERTSRKLSSLIGRESAKEITDAIDERVEQEHVVPAPTRVEDVMQSYRDSVESSPKHWSAQTRSLGGNTSISPTPELAERQALEENLRARGIPSTIRSGRAVPTNAPANEPTSQPPPEQQNQDGPTMLNLDAIIMEEASKKYWDDFAAEIGSGNFHRLFELLSEMLNRMKAIAPQSTHSNIDEILDVQWIQNTIEHGALDARAFYGIFHSIWEQLKGLHAPARDSEWDAWHDQILEEMNKASTTWSTLLPRVLNDFLRKLDGIEDAVARFGVLRGDPPPTASEEQS